MVETEDGSKPHPAFKMQSAAMREARLLAAELGLAELVDGEALFLKGGVHRRRVPAVDCYLLDAIPLPQCDDVLDDRGMIDDVAFRHREDSGVLPAQIVGSIVLGLLCKPGFGQEKHGQHVIATTLALTFAGKDGHHGREVFDTRQVHPNPAWPALEVGNRRHRLGRVIDFESEARLRRSFLPLIEMEAAEVGDLRWEVLDPASLDPQLFERTEAGGDFCSSERSESDE